MPKDAGTPVKAIANGYVIAIVLNEDNDPNSDFILIGDTPSSSDGWAYGHVVPPPGLAVGDPVSAGVQFTTVMDFNGDGSLGNDHLHLERRSAPTATKPENPLRHYKVSGAQLPSEKAVISANDIYFVPNKSNDPQDFPDPCKNSSAVCGAVDIIAEAHVEADSLVERGVYSIAFEVPTVPKDGTPVPTRTLAIFEEFANSERSGKFPVVYSPFSSDSSKAGSSPFKGRYVVTNARGLNVSSPDPSNGLENANEHAWYTNVKSGFNDAVGVPTSSDFARFNSEARYPDGDYTVTVKARAFDAATPEMAQKVVTIQNFRIHPLEIIIKDEFDNIKKLYRWIFDPVIDKFKRTIPTDIPLGAGNYTIEITFSEPAVNPTLSIDTIGTLALTSTDPARDQRTFTATLVVDETTQDGLRTMTITGKDLGGDDLLALGPDDTEINPATQLGRDANGNLQGAPGNTSVSFNIEPLSEPTPGAASLLKDFFPSARRTVTPPRAIGLLRKSHLNPLGRQQWLQYGLQEVDSIPKG